MESLSTTKSSPRRLAMNRRAVSEKRKTTPGDDSCNDSSEEVPVYRAERRESYPFMEVGFAHCGPTPGIEIPPLDGQGRLVPGKKPDEPISDSKRRGTPTDFERQDANMREMLRQQQATKRLQEEQIRKQQRKRKHVPSPVHASKKPSLGTFYDTPYPQQAQAFYSLNNRSPYGANWGPNHPYGAGESQLRGFGSASSQNFSRNPRAGQTESQERFTSTSPSSSTRQPRDMPSISFGDQPVQHDANPSASKGNKKFAEDSSHYQKNQPTEIIQPSGEQFRTRGGVHHVHFPAISNIFHPLTFGPLTFGGTVNVFSAPKPTHREIDRFIRRGVGEKELDYIKLIKLEPLEDTNPRNYAQISPSNVFGREQSDSQADVQGQNPIRATLESFPIKSCPPLVALSYVWGNDDPRPTILLNGKPFAIRENLTTALRQLQVLCPDMYIWTDAICIDQLNEEEKSHVVQHMDEIFYAAQRVYAWLGPADPGEEDGVGGDSSDALWAHLKELGDLFWREAGPNRSLVETPFDMDPILKALLPDLNERLMKPSAQGGFPTIAYSKFSNRIYWQRIWVLQEVYLARELIFCCGSKTMASRTLAGALILLESYQKYIVTNSGRHSNANANNYDLSLSLTSLNAGNDKSNILKSPKLEEFAFTAPCYPEMHRLIIYTSVYQAEVHSLRIAMTNFCMKELPRGSRSTDPRDMIFGLLGFANSQERGYIKADYKKSVEQVYRDTTRALLRNGWTDLLAWAQPLEKEIKTLPTWVPDFSSTILETMCSHGQAKPWLVQFRASANWPNTLLRAGDQEGSSYLRWPGVVIDTIDAVGTLWCPRSASREYGHAQHQGAGTQSSSSPSSSSSSGAMQSRSATYEAIYTFLSEAAAFAKKSVRRHPSPPQGIRDDNLTRLLEGGPYVPCAGQLVVNSKFARGRGGTGPGSIHSAYMSALNHAERYMKKNVKTKTNDDEEEEEEEEEIPEEGRAYVETILRWVKKRPMLSSQGYVGLVPGDARQGDLLVLLQNCNAPYILRRVSSSLSSPSGIGALEYYELVGEAYVWGVMDGEYTPREDQCIVFTII